MRFIASKPGRHQIDGVFVRTDSIMEAKFIIKLVRDGFSGKWRRPRSGLAYGSARYTPDVELCVRHDGYDIRVLVEFKPLYADQFPKEARLRMIAASHHYPLTLLMLYVDRTKQWYLVNKATAGLEACLPPVPGDISISNLAEPFSIPIVSSYGRVYRATFGSLFLRGVETFLIPRRRARARRQARKRVF